MKNTRWSRLAAWLVMLIMVLTFSVLTAVSLAESETEGVTPSEAQTQKKSAVSEGGYIVAEELATPPEAVEDVTASAVFTCIGVDNKPVSPADMDPNQENVLQISLSGLSTEVDVTKTPVLAVTLPDYVKLPANAAEAMGSAEVTGTIGENGQLELRWVGDRAEQLAVTLPIIPNAPADQDLSGEYALANLNNVLLTSDPHATAGRLYGEKLNMEGGEIKINTLGEPVWTLTHVTGNYYTVKSKTTGKYLYINTGNNGLYLVDGTQETAQRILVKNVGGDAYSFTVDNVSVNNYNNKAEDGYGAWKYGGGNNEKLKLLQPSFVQAAGKDLSGKWAMTFSSGGRKAIAARDYSGNLTVVPYTQNPDNKLFYPWTDISFWDFEHIVRDWYYVSTNGGYLNINDSGAFISGTEQPLLVKTNSNYSTIMLVTEAANNTGYSLLLNNDALTMHSRAGNTNYSDDTRITLKETDEVVYSSVEISGSWSIGTETTGGAVTVDAESASKLKSVPFYALENGSIYSTEGELAIFTFTKVEGNWYTLQDRTGQYLSISSNGVALTGSEARVFITEQNGKYRFTDGGLNALNNFNGKSTGGYGTYNNGQAKDKNEWQTLFSPAAVTGTMLLFDANGGSAEGTPRAQILEAGTTITLPNYNGTRQNERFIGWAETNAFYKNQGKSHNYHDLYKPGTTYTVKGGTTTLYAVWDNKVKTVQFFIRRDGIIHDEPSNYDTSQYTGELRIENALDESRWIIDLDGGNAIKDYYVNNNIMANLKIIPTQDQIVTWLKQQKETFDPETMYIHFYVLKSTNEGGQWHVDGVIRKKNMVSLSYNINVPSGEKDKVTNVPGGAQVIPGTKLLIGADKNGTEVKKPHREGYIFKGWNTAADGSGTTYVEGEYTELTNNLNLYAQWLKAGKGDLVVMIESDWTYGLPAYEGTPITLTAVLTGFEGKAYDLQWQYTTDQKNWYDEEGATGEQFTYVINDTTSTYTWRVVAKNVRDE